MRVNFSKTSSPVAYYGEDPAPEITTSPLPAQKPGKTGRNSEKMPISGPKHPLFGPEPGENANLRPKNPRKWAGTLRLGRYT
jgi:hypothetical protein